MPTTPTVDVIGLRALVRDANRLCADAGPLNRSLSEAGRTAANPIADDVRGEYNQWSGDLVASVRVTASKSGAAVRVGRAKVPYAGPVDFGGYPGERAFIANGRVLYPAAESLGEVAAQLYAEGSQRAITSFDWTNTGGAPHD